MVTDRSAVGVAAGVTLSVSAALLLAGVGSIVPDGTETVAVFVTVPLAADEIMAGTVNVAVPPATRSTLAAMLPVPEAGHVEPADAAHVQVPKVTLAGAVSVTVAPTTPPGPALDTTMVYVVEPPAVTALTPFGLRDREIGRRLVVRIGDRDVAGIDAVVDGVGAGRRGGHDGVGDVAVVQGVVDAGDRDGLRRVPVGGRKGEARRATVPSVVSLELRAIVTSAVGCVVSTTVNVAVPPASVVVRPEVGVTVIPAASLSVLVTATSAAFDAVVGGSALVAGAVTMV